MGKKKDTYTWIVHVSHISRCLKGSSVEEVQIRPGKYISIYSVVLRLKMVETGQKKYQGYLISTCCFIKHLKTAMKKQRLQNEITRKQDDNMKASVLCLYNTHVVRKIKAANYLTIQ